MSPVFFNDTLFIPDIDELTEFDVKINELIKTIEYTLLRADALLVEVEALCESAVKKGYHGVCVSPSRVATAVNILADSEVKVVSVAGFPLDNQTTTAKAAEVEDLLGIGVDEVDLVINVGLFLEGKHKEVAKEIAHARRLSEGKVLKTILETGLLTDEQIFEAGRIAVGEGVDFLKTSTGYGPRGASVRDIEILSNAVADSGIRIKASGGISTLPFALELVAAGAARLGTSRADLIYDALTSHPG